MGRDLVSRLALFGLGWIAAGLCMWALGVDPALARTQLGFNDSFVHHNKGLAIEEKGLAIEAASTGASYARFGAFQGAGRPWTESQMEEVDRAGLRPLLVLGPQSLAPENCAAFAREVAARHPTAVLEGLNEPNHEAHGGFTPRRTAKCHAAMSVAIAPRPILAPSLAPNAESLRYARRMLRIISERTGTRIRDIPLAIHPYPDFQLSGKDYVSHIRAQIRWYQRLRGKRDLWITELGVSSTRAFAGSEREQALILRRAILRAGELGVKAVVVHRVIDHPETNDWEAGLGVLRTDRTRKPAFYALQEMFGGTDLEPPVPNNASSSAVVEQPS